MYYGCCRSIDAQALEAMEGYGEVMVGGPPGDFNVIPQDNRDAVVSGHCPYMYTMVLKSEIEEKEVASEVMVGMFGRSKRQQDFETQKIVHREPARD